MTEIYVYTERRWGVDQAESYLQLLLTTANQLAQNPSLATKTPEDPHLRVYVAKWKNARQGHRIFFDETEDGIEILRVLHTAMNWREHLSADQ